MPGPLLWSYLCPCPEPSCRYAVCGMGGGGPVVDGPLEDGPVENGPVVDEAEEDESEEDDDEVANELVSADPMPAIKGFNRHLGVLNCMQTMHLHDMLSQMVNLNARGNFPMLTVSLYDLLRLIRERLLTQDEATSYFSRFPEEIASKTMAQVLENIRPQPYSSDIGKYRPRCR